MTCILRKIFFSILLVTPFASQQGWANTELNTPNFSYQFAMVRDLSPSFEQSLKSNPPLKPIDLQLAKQQHEHYIQILKELVPHVICLEGDIDHPDCNFVEDTALIINDTAVISRMGAVERRGEEKLVNETLMNLGMKKIIHLDAPCTMDGGDILYTGKHLFVGLSHRTNDHALCRLKEIFQGAVEVIGIPVLGGLHLKSAITLFDSETLIVADTNTGRKIQEDINAFTASPYAFVFVPDDVASNVLRIGSHLIIQEGFPASEAILKDLCEQKTVEMIKINMSELIKADGALTCGSLLFN